MPRAVTLAVLAAALLPAGCVGSGTGTTSGGSRASSGTLALGRSRPTRKYTLALSGRAETTDGAPHGRGYAIIAFHGAALVCWRFAHLHGFIDATLADIHAGRAGRTGAAVLHLSQGPRLHHEGCVSISPALTKTIWSDPARYYVSILSAQNPRGAVRAQL